MKSIISVTIALIGTALSSLTFAQASSIEQNFGLEFVAPQVDGTSNVGNPELGEIVFDISTSSFWGLTDTSPETWVELNSGITTSAQTFTGTKTFADGVKFDDAAGQSTLSFYQQETVASTFSFDGSGGGTSSSTNIIATRIGSTVMLWVPSVTASTGTSSANLSANTAIPSWARPTNTTVVFCGSVSSSGSETATERVNYTINASTGVIGIRREGVNSFPNSTSGNGSARGCMLQYDIAS